MEELQNRLQSIGLSDKEAACCLALLRYGTQATSTVAKRCSLNRGTTYVALHSLLDKGLVTKASKRSVQYFTAIPPAQFDLYINAKQAELERQRGELHAIIPELSKLSGAQRSRPKVSYYEGVDGARTALEQTLTAKDKLLRSFLSIEDIFAFLGPEYFDDYTSRRISSGYQLKVLRHIEKDRVAFSAFPIPSKYASDETANREVRYVADELAFPVTTYMFDDKVAFISTREENFAVIIQSHEIAQTHVKLFELLWGTAVRPPGSDRP